MSVVKVSYLASFQSFTGKESERIPVRENETFEDLVKRLSARYGTSFARRFDEHLAIVLLNGEQIIGNPILNDHDEILFAVLVGGG